ncbi:MAG TPA: glycoside hydrolase family 2 TIM barrel-domain containing protein [Acidobacteriaceae bacterium]
MFTRVIFPALLAALVVTPYVPASAAPAPAAQMVPPTVLVDVDHRPQQSLNGSWHYIVDPYRNGWDNWIDVSAVPSPRGYMRDAPSIPGGPLQEYDFAKSPTLEVPGEWNTQVEKLFFYEGVVWYERHTAFHPRPGTHVFLHFGAANYRANVAVNGTNLCQHDGGFTSFDCDATALLKDGDNSIVIGVDNTRRREQVPTLKSDWWNYGGLTGAVSLVEVPEIFIDDESLALQKGGARITGYAHLAGASAGQAVHLRIPELHVDQAGTTDADGRAAFSFAAEGLQRWSPEHPQLYAIEWHAGTDTLRDDIGFRTIEVQGDQILLNGKPVFLRGVSLHAEVPRPMPEGTGRAWSDADAKLLLGWVKELDGNFVRLTHYPHQETMTREADRLGLLVWSEIPVYWSIDWKSEAALASAQQQLREMIRRDRNKASVVLWSMSNETPNSPERVAFLRKLIDQARADDATRLITSAIVTSFHNKVATLDDPLGQYLDVLGYNEYLGWYQAKPEEISSYTWQDPLGKPVIMSEFGAGARAGLHEAATYRFSEEYEAEVYRQQFLMFAKIPFLRGLSPWVLMDFRSPTRQLPGVQDGYNRKGLISSEGIRKQAFSVLRDEYRKMPQ